MYAILEDIKTLTLFKTRRTETFPQVSGTDISTAPLPHNP